MSDLKARSPGNNSGATAGGKRKVQRRILVEYAHREILAWFALNARMFPWRQGTHPSPYVVLVSEYMLQQTQVSRVAQRLPDFLKHYPTVEALAAESNAGILRIWSGMGYNSRALRLRDCARAIVSHFQGIVPRLTKELLSLPGIGPYTAAAVQAFAYHIDTGVVDVNIRRVFSRFFFDMPTTAAMIPEKRAWDLANEIVPKGLSSEWHQAIMDLGSLLCTRHNPKCGACPLVEYCRSANKMEQIKTQPKVEPSHRSVPRRIWRGRILRTLHRVHPHRLPLNGLATDLFGEDLESDLDFLGTLVCQMEKEGLVWVDQPLNASFSISLPKEEPKNHIESS